MYPKPQTNKNKDESREITNSLNSRRPNDW